MAVVVLFGARAVFLVLSVQDERRDTRLFFLFSFFLFRRVREVCVEVERVVGGSR